MKFKSKIFLIVLFCLSSQLVFSQLRNEQKPSEKQPPAKKDTVVFRMHNYNLVDGFSRRREVKLDTVINDFHSYNPVFRNLISAQTLGNLGASYKSNDFFQTDRNPDDFLFTRNYKLYGIWPENIRFYNVTKPFTELGYGQWFSNKPKGETWLRVLHTQNVTPRLNFGLLFNSISSQGKYLNQEAKDNSLNFTLTYNGERYDAWFAVGKNKFSNQENGGLPNPKDIENPDLKPENIAVWLNGVHSEAKNSFFLLSHQYKLGTWKEVKEKNESFQTFITRVAFMHTFEYSTNTRNFTELDPNPFFQYTDGRGVVYYYGAGATPNINSTVGVEGAPATRDESGERRVTNKFIIKSVEAPDRKFTFGKQAFIGNDLINVFFPREKLIYTPGIWMPPLGLSQSYNLTNTFLGGSIFRTEGKFWKWDASGKYYIQGYRVGDFELNGKMEKPFVTAKDTSFVKLTASMNNITPDYFYNHYYSNHFKWNNNFNRTYELRLGADYENPGIRFNAGFRYSIVNNFIYMNELSLPDQANSGFSVVEGFINKDFKIGILNIRNWITYQKSTTQKYMHLPQLMARNTIYLKGIYAKVLNYHFGLDTRYESSYYADYYNPSLGMFHVQGNEKIGNYPWMDVFVDLKIKRTRFYVKYSNLGASMLKGGSFRTPNYPEQPALLGFGLSWTFYD